MEFIEGRPNAKPSDLVLIMSCSITDRFSNYCEYSVDNVLSVTDPVPAPSKPAQLDDPFADFLGGDISSNVPNSWSTANQGSIPSMADITPDAFGGNAGVAPQSKTSTKDAIMALYGPAAPAGSAAPYGMQAMGMMLL